MKIQVKNDNDSLNFDSKKLLEIWEEKKGQKGWACCNLECDEKATDGIYVEKTGKNEDGKKYIIPVCRSCKNMKNFQYYINIDKLLEVK
ncbi:MAG: hypothetical protein MJH09_08425 [Cetobacterium sp.]|uniref:Uncharacterized protein n=1 Tax=Cetobacterium ceti TaxID=180163 RepID=A0A1T4PAD4_9FUSO|nr:hypothetical protein [Cetobacterium ceti]MCJ8342856.1 hypothetical protein [Cetobacterium sp.]SJZ88297.1 hypothetical protein SAMN02745174_01840 [Cetobacterium ceti]